MIDAQTTYLCELDHCNDPAWIIAEPENKMLCRKHFDELREAGITFLANRRKMAVQQ
jgi:hypothetical protein